MADVSTTEDGMRSHLEADPPDGHGIPDPAAAAMSMSAMTTRHDEMHAAGADHTHADMPMRSAIEVDAAIHVRDLAKREIDMRLLRWGQVINTNIGPEEFTRGAFAETDPSSVLLMGLEHEVHFGLAQDGQTPKLTRHPVGKAMRVSEEADGPHATFRVAKTQRGDEVLALAEEGIVTGVSIEFSELPGGSRIESRQGRRTTVHNRVKLNAVSTTYRPAYGEQATVLAVRSHTEGDAPMGDEKAPEVGAVTTKEPEKPDLQTRAIDDAVNHFGDQMDAAFGRLTESFTGRIEKLEERARSAFVVPGIEPEAAPISRAEWMSIVLRMRSGESIPHQQLRAAEDIISSDNIGIVPPAYLTELIGVIDASRPFLSSTRRLPTPVSGMSMVVPVITQRPTVAEQTTEKSALSTQTTKISTQSFDMVTKGGYGDISLQLLKRADRSFLDLYLQLLAEAYAIEAESEAVEALLHANEPLDPTALDPENLLLGAAYQNSFDAIRRPPDTIWLSTEAVGGFIDAKATTTNAPLYPGLVASATAAGGITGTISGLRPVHTPALDAHGSYAIVGPSNGFAWAEDGTFTLQVDVPSKAGRDVALVGMLWFAPWYPDAFTIYNVAS